MAHIGFEKPTCGQLSGVLADACDAAGVKTHRGGTYVCMEGPQFSTLAEAHVHRQLRFDVIGMTNVTEAKLAREAELCYSVVAMITDYDCWHPEHSSVTIADILSNLNRNAENAQNVIRRAVRAHAGRTLLQVRPIAQARDYHRPKGDSGSGAAPSGCHRRKISFLRGLITHVPAGCRFGGV